MKVVTANPARRSRPKTRTAGKQAATGSGKTSAKTWTPPDFKKRLREDFNGKIMPFSYVDFLER